MQDRTPQNSMARAPIRTAPLTRCEGDDGQVVYLAYSGNEIRNQVNGEKA